MVLPIELSVQAAIQAQVTGEGAPTRKSVNYPPALSRAPQSTELWLEGRDRGPDWVCLGRQHRPGTGACRKYPEPGLPGEPLWLVSSVMSGEIPTPPRVHFPFCKMMGFAPEQGPLALSTIVIPFCPSGSRATDKKAH